MRLQRTPTDFRVVEQLDRAFLETQGEYQVVRATWKSMSTEQVASALAQSAKVQPDQVSWAGGKDRGGLASQYFTVHGGGVAQLSLPDVRAAVVGHAPRAITPDDVPADAYEVIVRDLSGDDMRRLRHNLAQMREIGMPNYFDDPRFGCLRHGQGFIMRNLLKGRFEEVAKSMLCAASPYGSDTVERFKHGIRQRWGDWKELISYCRDRRGMSLFKHLAENPGDFEGGLRVGFSTRERNIHLFAFQSHLWNRAVAVLVKRQVRGENLAWLPGDAGTLPVYRELPKESDAGPVRAALGPEFLPLPGAGPLFDDVARRFYQPVFDSEGFSLDDFLGLDIPGFRPLAEDRPVLVRPEFLRAAPAERDDLYPRARRMRVRFTLPRGHYPTLILKRLLMPTEPDTRRHVMWISRHPLVWPDDDGNPRVFEAKSREDRDRGRDTRGGRDGGREGDRGRDHDRDRDRGPRPGGGSPRGKWDGPRKGPGGPKGSGPQRGGPNRGGPNRGGPNRGGPNRGGGSPFQPRRPGGRER